MKSGKTVAVLRALLAGGVLSMALLGLVACATTKTTPVSRQADPAFARTVVTYPARVPPAQSLSIRGVTFSTWYRTADKRSVTGSASAGRDLGGRVRRPFTANRNGRIGTRPLKCCNGSPNSENT
jgi:hypothetical protein